MPSKEEMRAKVLAIIGGDKRITEKSMFGGYGYLINGNMFVAATSKGMLMVKVPKNVDASKLPGTGGPVKAGFLILEPEVTAKDANIRAWYAACLAAAEKLPPK